MTSFLGVLHNYVLGVCLPAVVFSHLVYLESFSVSCFCFVSLVQVFPLSSFFSVLNVSGNLVKLFVIFKQNKIKHVIGNPMPKQFPWAVVSGTVATFPPSPVGICNCSCCIVCIFHHVLSLFSLKFSYLPLLFLPCSWPLFLDYDRLSHI